MQVLILLWKSFCFFKSQVYISFSWNARLLLSSSSTKKCTAYTEQQDGDLAKYSVYPDTTIFVLFLCSCLIKNMNIFTKDLHENLKGLLSALSCHVQKTELGENNHNNLVLPDTLLNLFSLIERVQRDHKWSTLFTDIYSGIWRKESIDKILSTILSSFQILPNLSASQSWRDCCKFQDESEHCHEDKWPLH